MNIFKRELKANFRSLLIWSAVTVLFIILGVSKFSAYYNNPDMLSILDNMPAAIKSILDTQAFNLTTLTGFFGIMFTYSALLLSIAAAIWGSDIIAKEQRDKTVEFSLTLPVTRSRVVFSKTLSALVNCIGLLLVNWGISVAVAQPYSPDAEFYRFMALTTLALFIMQLVFLAVGVLLGCVMKRYKMASTAALFVLLGTYFLSVFTTLNQSLDFLNFLTPFKYFNPADLLHESRIDFVYVGLSIVIVAVSLVAARAAYEKRDLYI